VKARHKFKWFEDWVLGRQTYDRLALESGLSKRTLQNIFTAYLKSAPPIPIKPKEGVHLLIDGTYFTNDLCLVLYHDNDVKFTQLYRLSDGERYLQVKEDLLNLKELGVILTSITCDGHRAVLKAIKEVYPDIRLQRCQFHVMKRVLFWLRYKPKSIAGQELRELAKKISQVKTTADKQYLFRLLLKWYADHKAYITQKTVNEQTGKWRYTHRKLQSSYGSIKRAWPNLFHYLEDSAIPATTNGLESYFSHLKSHLTVHRGLTQEHKKQFIRWYLHLKNAASGSEFSKP
jgi:AraC-like DNA-binding protein